MKITNKMVIEYLIDCKGYDDGMIEDLKEMYGKNLVKAGILDSYELRELKEYYT